MKIENKNVNQTHSKKSKNNYFIQKHNGYELKDFGRFFFIRKFW